MVAHSDTAMIGTVTRLIDEERVPSPAPPGEESKYVDVIKNYEVRAEQFIFPEAQQPKKVVIRAMAGIGSTDTGMELSVEDDPPQEFHVGERVLLFLEVLPNQAYAQPGIQLPAGIERNDYNVVVTSTRYGKLNAVGEKWRDNGSRAETTIAEIEAAARAQNK